MQYNFNEIEAKWQKYWKDNQTFKAQNPKSSPPLEGLGEAYYVLDMFPYPSGAGLHVGHPLGYIASDIVARYKRHKGFNVLHPQGYDSFGLPAEQYAIQTGQHPAITTDENIKTYRRQLDQIGFSYDWSREVRTSDPSYYKWTQWIFIQLFESWYNNHTDKAESIASLIENFEKNGNQTVNAVCDEDVESFTAEEWKQFDDEKKQEILLKYRLTYLAETEVNWCPALGTVLANDEIVNGVSERGGHPVVRKKMTQWSMRISAYAERLLQGLEKIDWSDAIKETQRNWIGRSEGASVKFKVQDSKSLNLKPETLNSKNFIEVFTTRPDTIFGVSFMTLAPEHELVAKITTPEQKAEVEAYIEATAKRSERDRMSDVKTITGVFTGAYAEHPFTKEPIPIWIGDYVLASYGTGAVMSVPAGDQRDYDFAKHFGIPIPNIFEGVDISEEAYSEKDETPLKNSNFLNGLAYKEATKKVIAELEKMDQGKGKTNYRLRDAVFSRQRYWGEPFPVYYENGMPQMIDEKFLAITLPEIEKYLPTETGEPPLGRAEKWYWLQYGDKAEIVSKETFERSSPSGRLGGALELNTMPGWAGSSQYFNRYMDPHNDKEIFSQEAVNYWKQVDLYIGGSEHATGHLLYARFWQKFMFDKGLVPVDEPFKKLINQGMILGTSAFVYKLNIGLLFINANHNSEAEFISRDVLLKKKFLISQNWLNEIGFDKSKRFARRSESSNILFDTIKNCLDNEVFVNDEIKELFYGRNKDYEISFEPIPLTSNVSYVNGSDELDIEAFKKWRPEFKDAIFIGENGKVLSFGEDLGEAFKVGREVEKMSKSKYNVVNPDDICKQYGADSLRLYEMFLGPLEQYKPWNTAGITGVHSFLKKLWKLYVEDIGLKIDETEPTKDNLKTLHKTIKKVQDDIDNFSFNTSVSTFMIAVNELTTQKCTSKDILEPLLVLISPYAPHIAEQLYACVQYGRLIDVDELPEGYKGISEVEFPKFEEKYLVENSKVYPISFNGKTRFTMELPLELSKEEIEKEVMANEKTQAQLEGRTPKKVIVVPGKIVNIVG